MLNARFGAAPWSALVVLTLLGGAQAAFAQGNCTGVQVSDFTSRCAASGASYKALETYCVVQYGDHYFCGYYRWPSKVTHAGDTLACSVQWQRSPSGREGGPPSSVSKVDALTCSPPPTLPDPGKNAGKPCGSQTDCGNPINIATGNKHQQETDFEFGRAGLSVARTYNSQGNAADVGFGLNWSFTYSRAIDYFGDIDQKHATVWAADGKAQYFARADVASPWIGDVDGRATLTSTGLDVAGNPTGWRLRTNAGLEVYDAAGRLSALVALDGKTVSAAYSCRSGDAGCVSPTPDALARTSGLLVGATDAFGRTLTFAHGDDARILSVTTSAGEVYGYGYESIDPASNLSLVTFPDSTTRHYLYGEPAMVSPTPDAGVTYLHSLTGLLDESGVRFATWTYDAHGSANSSAHAGGVDRVQLAFGSDGTAVTDTTGTSRKFGYQTIAGTVHNASLDVACNGCTTGMTYDTNGNKLSEDDFNGNRVCHGYDVARNLETVTVEGLPSTKACPSNLATYAPSTTDAAHPERKTTVSWHPVWSVQARVAEPKKITTRVYNGQPDPIAGGTAACAPAAPALPDGNPITVLCAGYEQATTDATGALGLSATTTGVARKWSYTYNAAGQMLTASAPRQSATDSALHTTSYAYYTVTALVGNVGHTLGDFFTVTNPLGQKTTFTSYDGAGHLLASTDANGATTSLTYWPRGWVKTQTVASASGAVSLVTRYDYRPTGLLQTVTLPDGAILNYAYDDAHRLTDVTDAAGNRVHYVLDDLGNRTSEQVSDASGTLAVTVTRAYDGFNRLRTQTGGSN